LASRGIASFLTGSELVIDGGFMALRLELRHCLGIHSYMIIRDKLEGTMNYRQVVLAY
jgi:hypothetical protein